MAKWLKFYTTGKNQKIDVLLWQNILSLLIFLFFVVSVFIFQVKIKQETILLLIISGGAIAASWFVINEKVRKIILVTVIATGGLNLFLNYTMIPELYSKQGARQALLIYEQNRSVTDTLVTLHIEEYEIFFMADSPVKSFSTWENFYSFLTNNGSWVYTNKRGYEVVKELTPGIEQVYTIPHRGMNRVSLPFLFPQTRESALNSNYLIKVK